MPRKVKEKKLPWTVLGRVVGIASGWDQSDAFSMMLYDFEPATGSNLPAGVICIDFETGLVETYDDAGTVLTSRDLVSCISQLPRDPELGKK